MFTIGGAIITHCDVPAETVPASAVAVTADPITDLVAAGVAIWLDDLSRARLATGGLADLVRDSHVVGVTTNPTIFQKAMSHSDSYDRQNSDLALRCVEVEEAARMITTFDVRWVSAASTPRSTTVVCLRARGMMERVPQLPLWRDCHRR
jgi:transaldolase